MQPRRVCCRRASHHLPHAPFSQVEYFREPLQSWQQLHPAAAEQLKALLQDVDAGYNPAFLLQLVCDDLAFSSEQAMDLLNCLHG